MLYRVYALRRLLFFQTRYLRFVNSIHDKIEEGKGTFYSSLIMTHIDDMRTKHAIDEHAKEASDRNEDDMLRVDRGRGIRWSSRRYDGE